MFTSVVSLSNQRSRFRHGAEVETGRFATTRRFLQRRPRVGEIAGNADEDQAGDSDGPVQMPASNQNTLAGLMA